MVKQENVFKLKIGDVVVCTNKHNYTWYRKIVRVELKSVYSQLRDDSSKEFGSGTPMRESWNYMNSTIKNHNGRIV